MEVQTEVPMSLRFKPAVPRRYIFALAGILWTFAGAFLCIRAAIWLEVFPFATEFAMESLSVVLAVATYFLMFSSLVDKNIVRIQKLPDRACMFAFTAWRGYLMIALMMTIGITLRSTSIPKYYLSIPYTAMGATLLIGSIGFYRQFLAVVKRKG
jgi:hypothetical protein